MVDNTIRLLDLFDRHQVKGTFFVLGWVAQQRPDLVREIHRRGHEVGSHSYWHRLIYTLSPSEFREDLRRSRDVLEEIVGPKNVLTSSEDLVSYSFDGTFAEHRPDVVVQPATTEEVSRVVALANGEEIAVVPRGMASGMAGASIPFGGGLALSLIRMNRILEIDRRI